MSAAGVGLETRGAPGDAALADALEAHADALARGPIEQMYREDPFWEDRFGARGRRFADEDGHYHVSYLVEALRAGSPGTLVAYVRWLRSVLTARGMSSLHVEQNLARLGQAITAQAIPAAESAHAYLRAARESLSYAEGTAARAVQDVTPRGDDADRDAARLLGYLADALAQVQVSLFADHAAWLPGYLARHGAPPVRYAEVLAVVEQRVASIPQSELRRAANAVLLTAPRAETTVRS